MWLIELPTAVCAECWAPSDDDELAARAGKCACGAVPVRTSRGHAFVTAEEYRRLFPDTSRRAVWAGPSWLPWSVRRVIARASRRLAELAA